MKPTARPPTRASAVISDGPKSGRNWKYGVKNRLFFDVFDKIKGVNGVITTCCVKPRLRALRSTFLVSFGKFEPF